jgi:NAD(P)-dependent dehydrogenase (short-subunit alcohol dehydrogenase family)
MEKIVKVIVVCGGSGYLGGKIIEALVGPEVKIVNISSREHADSKLIDLQFCGDLTNSVWVTEVLQKIPETLDSKIYAILNFAGRSARNSGSQKPVPEHLSEIVHDLEIFLNLASSFLNSPDLFAPKARMIDIGSLWASGIPFSNTYLDLGNEPDLSVIASKSAKKSLVRYFAREFGKLDFMINQVTPGWFPKPSANPREDYIAGIVDRIPLERIGIPLDLISAYLMLLSEKTNYITGQEIIIDGGASIY